MLKIERQIVLATDEITTVDQPEWWLTAKDHAVTTEHKHRPHGHNVYEIIWSGLV